MAFNEKRHCVFPLVPTSSAYAELNGYFGKLQNSKIEVLQAQWDFGGNLSAPKVLRGKQRLRSKMESRKSIISEMKGAIQNRLLRVVNTISGCSGDADGMWELKEIGNFAISEDDLGGCQKQYMGNIKT